MTSPLPPSHEGRALAEAIEVLGAALEGTHLSLAVVRNGVLHPVTDADMLTPGVWALIDAAVRDGAMAHGRGQDGRHRTVVLVPPIPGTEPHAPLPQPSGVLLATRVDGREHAPQTTALLRLVALQLRAAAADAEVRGRIIDLMGEYVGVEVADAVLHQRGRVRLGGHTRDVSVLFADLRGFTSLSEVTAPDAVVALLNRYFEQAVPAITRHGGTVSAFIGDAIMGLFGAPASRPEHPLLAARAALDLRDAVEAIAADAQAPRFRVGVATGPATVGNIGSPRRRVYTAIGDTVNLASRLESQAAVGQVLISAETYGTIRVVANAEEIPPLKLKGKREPVRAWILHGLREGAEKVVGDDTLDIPFERLRSGR